MRTGHGLLAGLVALGCSRTPLPIPPDLTRNADRWELPFQISAERKFGPFTFEHGVTESEEQTSGDDPVRHVKASRIEVQLQSAEGASVKGQCVDAYAWTSEAGSSIAEDVFDALNCGGQVSDGSTWKLQLEPAQGFHYAGTVEGGGTTLEVQSLHEKYAGLETAARGYLVKRQGTVVGAVKNVFMNDPGMLWIRRGTTPAERAAAVAALGSLLLFTPGR